jgi:hypothetical protein
MAISVTGNKKIKTLQKEFNEAFPYLHLSIFPLSDKKKRQKMLCIHQYPGDKRISEVRTKVSPGEISIHGRTLVKNLEKEFENEYGLYAEVCYTEKDDERYYTSGKHDEMSLTQLNKEGEKKGWKKDLYNGKDVI